MFRYFIGLAGGWEFFGIVTTVLLGVGGVGYVGATWLMHFISIEQYVSAALLVVTVTIFSGLAALRIPAAQYFFFGSVAVIGTAFLSGAIGVLLP
ncbi:MAG: hypothetical protein ABIP34_00050 [Rhodoferax sp.]|uniref:hypothetical protein n=1 Tax=Rhodoferax sp. TaxID=50421 RepID=UPI0032643E52